MDDDSNFLVKFELEIYVDDVVCLYGFICGVLDEMVLYYLWLCGVLVVEVIDMLMFVFFVEVLDEIENEDLVDDLCDCFEVWLVCCC